ncbi:MAG: glycoside hydrolase family 28 protein [Sedimentisphaerales bacterium]|nr:glycoside hydrolase family 28 protein [Sedimentisphaerales bacterium]
MVSLLLALFTNFNCIFTASSSDEAIPMEQWTQQVGAKKTPDKKIIFKVNDYGAKNDGQTLATKQIQAAIDACAAKGGGIVTFDPGKYLTGSIFVKEGVNLRIDKGVTILGSQDIADYPEIDTRAAGIELKWPAALINIIDQKNAAITGDGVVNARGKPFWDKYWTMRREEYEPKGLRWIVDYDCKRPRTVLVQNCSDITIQGITFQQAGFWTVHILYSKYVTVDGIVIQNNIDGSGPSTDGIDIDSSSFVLVENCDIDCNDDNFCLKAGRDWDGLRVNRPTEYVVIRDCISRKGGGLITFGSETSGSIRHLLAQNLKAKGTGVGLRFKSARTRGGTVEDVYLQDIEMDGVGTVIEVSMNWNPSYSYSSLPEGYDPEKIPQHWKTMLMQVEPPEKGIPEFKDVHISHVIATGASRAISASGTKESIVKDFHLSEIDIKAKSAGSISYADGWEFENVTIKTGDNSELDVRNSNDMKL